MGWEFADRCSIVARCARQGIPLRVWSRPDGPALVPVTTTPRRREIASAALRVLALSALLMVLYAVWPLHGDAPSTVVGRVAAFLLVLGAMFAFQVRSILYSARPAFRAIEAITTSISVMLFAFSSGYLALSHNDPAAFSEPLSKVSAMYFTITAFATVGFGDITPVSEVARVIVSVQMLLNLLLLGLGIRIISVAVRLGRERQASPPDTATG